MTEKLTFKCGHSIEKNSADLIFYPCPPRPHWYPEKAAKGEQPLSQDVPCPSCALRMMQEERRQVIAAQIEAKRPKSFEEQITDDDLKWLDGLKIKF